MSPNPSLDLGLLNPNRYPEAGARALRPWLERVAAALIAELGAGQESFAARFCGDREMRRVSLQFRGQDKTTDVLSFPGDGEHLGDVLISVPAARRQALERAHSNGRELRVLLLHGLLHCLGYDHESDDGEMERLERRLRRRFLDLQDGGDDV